MADEMKRPKVDPNITFAQKALELLSKQEPVIKLTKYQLIRDQLNDYVRILEKDVGPLKEEYKRFVAAATEKDLRALQNTISRNITTIRTLGQQGYGADYIFEQMMKKAGIK